MQRHHPWPFEKIPKQTIRLLISELNKKPPLVFEHKLVGFIKFQNKARLHPCLLILSGREQFSRIFHTVVTNKLDYPNRYNPFEQI